MQKNDVAQQQVEVSRRRSTKDLNADILHETDPAYSQKFDELDGTLAQQQDAAHNEYLDEQSSINRDIDAAGSTDKKVSKRKSELVSAVYQDLVAKDQERKDAKKKLVSPTAETDMQLPSQVVQDNENAN